MDGAAAAAAEVSEPAGEPYRRLQDAIKRTTAPPKKGADGGAGGEGEGPGAIDPACWAELKQLLKGGPEEAAAQAFTLLLGQLRDRRIEVRARALALLDRLVQRSAAVRRRALDQLRVRARVGYAQCIRRDVNTTPTPHTPHPQTRTCWT